VKLEWEPPFGGIVIVPPRNVFFPDKVLNRGRAMSFLNVCVVLVLPFPIPPVLCVPFSCLLSLSAASLIFRCISLARIVSLRDFLRFFFLSSLPWPRTFLFSLEEDQPAQRRIRPVRSGFGPFAIVSFSVLPRSTCTLHKQEHSFSMVIILRCCVFLFRDPV